MLYMIDNYDSFTYNLVQYFQMLGAEVTVRRNDEVTVDEVLSSGAEAIVLSPGPGRPETAGIMPALIPRVAEAGIPLLGVCLGHQAIGAAFGTRVVRARRLMHGKLSALDHDGRNLFAGVAQKTQVVRYHSLALEEASLPACLEVTARSEDGEIMGVRHKALPIEGIQYHPESILTQSGKRQLRNFLLLAAEARQQQKEIGDKG